MKVALINGAYPRRDVVARGVAHKLGGDAVRVFSCIEDVLESSMDYDVFVVYNNFEKKMNGIDGVREIRARAAEAIIVGVSAVPYMQRQFIPAGANKFMLLAGNEISELGDLLVRYQSRLESRTFVPPAMPDRLPAIPPPPAPEPEPEPEPAPARPVESAPTVSHLVYTLERARLVLDYALTNPDPADLRQLGGALLADMERIIEHFYATSK